MGRQFAGALSGVGQQTQGLRQALNDMRYADFLDQQNYPLRSLSMRQSAIGMTPMGSVSRQPVQGGSQLGGILGGLGGLLSGGAKLAPFLGLCWVAREVYGVDSIKWVIFREWILSEAPNWLFNLYAKFGERFAEYIADKPRIKKIIRHFMDKAIS